MNISRFIGSTNREALRQVRLALGPDALIISNKRVNGGVEILATDPTSTVDMQQLAETSLSEPDVDVMGAIGALRGSLETRIDELMWGNQLRRAPEAVSLFQALLGHGFSTALLRAMLKRLPDHLVGKAAFQWARNELSTHLPVLSSEDDLWKPGLALALVGPTGVGKTTTIAKLAARCLKRGRPDSLVLLTTDTYRIGAHEQLKIYGQIMRVPVHVVQDTAELQHVMQTIRADQTILIDNVGISQRDRYISEQAAMLASAGRQINRLLVLNASSHGDTLDEVARTYANDGGSPLKGCIITKVDEASRLGAALDTAIRYRLPVHYVSNGQKVPENLLFLPAAELVDQALVPNQQTRALYAPTEADFAALMALSKGPEDDTHAAVAESRRKRLLPGLLSMAAETGPDLSMGDLDAACAYVDQQTCASEAYDIWRSYTSEKQDETSLAGYVEHMLRIVQGDLAKNSHRYVLAAHDQVAVAASADSRGYLRASLLLDENAVALTTPVQQISFAHGWQSSCGASAQTPPTSAAALLHQVQWLSEHSSKLPLVHLFEGGSQALLRKISESNVLWLAQCAATTRVEYDSCATTVGALAKSLDHRPIASPVYSQAFTEIAGLPVDDVVLWVANEAIEVVARQQDSLMLQLVSVRIVRRADGATIKVLHGLSNMFSLVASPEQLAAWLVVRLEAKQGLRYAARAWRLLAQRDGAESSQKKALAVAQLGMAAWQYKQHANAELARRVGASLIGKPGLPSVSAMPAVLKLFALKEMVAA